jgi:salicylate hydroxylase
VQGDVLVGADGLWSRVRERLLADGAPRVTGHVAYRAMVPQHSLLQRLRCTQVTVWMGPKLHVVQYPVRGGDWLNVVAILHGRRDDVEVNNWDNLANVAELRAALAGACAGLRDLIAAIDYWRLWVLCDRPPMRGPQEQARDRVALLGDAAHPMRPYMAQGAGMAIEDAHELGRVLAADGLTVPEALQRYALQRWQRNARVQARSIRNGEVFHARGLAGWARDLSLRLLGEPLLDVPWLYGGP